MAAKKKTQRKVKKEQTGTGMLRQAAEKAASRARTNCEASGGTFNAKTGRCSF